MHMDEVRTDNLRAPALYDGAAALVHAMREFQEKHGVDTISITQQLEAGPLTVSLYHNLLALRQGETHIVINPDDVATLE